MSELLNNQEFMTKLNESVQNKTYNPDKLNPKGKQELNEIFKAGGVQGYTSLDEYILERDTAKVERGIEIAEAAEPGRTAIREATGLDIDRSSMELMGELTAGVGTYLGFREDLTKAYKKSKLNPVKVDFTRNSKELGAVLGKQKKLKGKKGLIQLAIDPKARKGLFDRTSNFFGRVADAFVGSDYGAVARRAGVSSALAGAGGAAAGSLFYDGLNAQRDFVINASLDLGNVTDNEIQKLPTTERMTYYALDAFKNSLLWTGGTSAALTGMLRMGSFIGRTLTGTRGEKARELAIAAKRLYGSDGLPLTVLANQDTVFGQLVGNYFKAGGLVPGVGPVGERAKRRLIETAMGKFTGELTEKYGMLAHTEFFGHSVLPLLRENYTRYNKLIDLKFANVDDASKLIDPENNFRIIPTKNLQEARKQIVGKFDETQLEAVQELFNAGALNPTLAKALPDNTNTIALLRMLGTRVQGGGRTRDLLPKNITLKEYQGLKVFLNNIIKTSPKNDDTLLFTQGIRTAMESDFNSVARAKTKTDFAENFRGNEKISKDLLDIADGKAVTFGGKTFTKSNADAIAGPEGAVDVFANDNVSIVQKAYLNHVKDGIGNFGKELQTANDFMTRLLQPFDRGALRSALKKMDDNVFTTSSMLGIMSKGIPVNEMYNNIAKNVLKSGSRQAIQDFKFFLNTNQQKGRNFFTKLKQRHIFDAFFQSFENPPMGPAMITADYFKKAKKNGLFNTKYFDQAYKEATQQGSVNPFDLTTEVLKTKNVDLMGVDARKFNVSLEELGDFDAQKFVKNLGLDTEDGVAAFAEILADTSKLADVAKARKYIENTVIPFIGSLRMVSEMGVGNVSTMIARQTQLGGARSFIFAGPAVGAFAGTAAAGMGFIEALTLPLMLRGIGYILTRPKLASKLLDAYTPEELIERKFKTDKKGKLKFKALTKEGLPAKRRVLGAIINYMNEETDDSLQIDVNKISPEEITRKMLEAPTVLPDTDFDLDVLDEEMLVKAHPEYVAFRDSSQEQKINKMQFIEGVTKGMARADLALQADDITDDEMLAQFLHEQPEEKQEAVQQQQAPLPTLPPQASTQQPTMMPNINYGMLFPDDPMGQLIADRRKSIGGPKIG